MKIAFRQNHSRSVFQWFLSIYLIIFLIFCISLLPLLIYVKNVFSTLQKETLQHQLFTASTQFESVVNGLNNASSVLAADTRFRSIRYSVKKDPASIPVNDLSQLKKTFYGLSASLNLITYGVLQIDADGTIVVTKEGIFPSDKILFYPDFFCVNDFSRSQWTALLDQYDGSFLPMQRVKASGKEYEALIYTTDWNSAGHLYACIPISDIRKLLFGQMGQTGYYLTISDLQDEILYTDLPAPATEYQTFSTRNFKCRLNISIHVDPAVFNRKMQPLYLFVSVYCFVLIIGMLILILSFTRITARPVLDIIQILEHSRHIPTSGNTASESDERNTPLSRQHGFRYISASIHAADTHLGQYQNIIFNQQKILQARFMEKALTGQLIALKDIQNFHLYFPDFPKSYCLLLVHLWSYTENKMPYQEPMHLISAFLQAELPDVYQQQLSDSELLLLLSEEDFDRQRKTLDFLVDNINREEPTYFIRCIASRICHHLESLPIAYRQLQDMDSLSFQEERTRVCTISDSSGSAQSPFTLPEFLTLYNAITYGNRDMALAKLRSYADTLGTTQYSPQVRHVYEMLETLLTCIKLEHPQQLADLHIPPYQTGTDLYLQFQPLILHFCDLLHQQEETESDSFVKDVLRYIDANYTDSNLCLTTLETHFKCSPSTIYKAFKKNGDMTVANYITQKRMNLANELLAKNQKTINEIALECGFANVNTFYKAYKRVHGHAPTMPN